MKEIIRWWRKTDWAVIGNFQSWNGVTENFLSPYAVKAWEDKRTGDIRITFLSPYRIHIADVEVPLSEEYASKKTIKGIYIHG